EIRGAGGFREFRGAGGAPLLNADSDTEATFIQAEGGLGDLWMVARTGRQVPWERLWDMFSLHVVGLGGVGYNAYKSCAAAANNLYRHGSLYAGPFCAFSQEYVALLKAPVRGGLHRLLADTTE